MTFRARAKALPALACAILLISACSSAPAGSGKTSEGVRASATEEAAWEPVFEDGVLQPLPDGFPNETITLVNVDEAASSDGLYARAFQEALREISPVSIQVSDQPSPVFGTWAGLQAVMEDEAGVEGYSPIVAALTGSSLDFLTAPITEELGFTTDDINPVIATEKVPFVVISPSDAPWDTYEEMVEQAKAAPGTLRYISLGVGSQLDLAMTSLMRSGEWEAEKIPIEDPVEATTIVAAGEGDFTMMLPDVAQGQAEAGRVKGLLVVGDSAPEPWTDATTTADLGLDEPWGSVRGFIVPPNTPDLHRQWLFELFKAGAQEEAYQDRITNTPGAEQVELDHDQVLGEISRLLVLAEPIVRDLGLHIDQQ